MKLASIFFVSFTALLRISEASAIEWIEVEQFSYNLMKKENLEAHGTHLFRHQPSLHVRHGMEVHLVLQLREQCDGPFEFKLVENEATMYAWKQQPDTQRGESHFRLYLNKSIPVGQYGLCVRDPCSKDTVHLSNVAVIFSSWPDRSSHRVRRQTGINNEEYINNNNGLIWLYTTPIPWNYAVGSTTVINSRDRLIQFMSQAERSDNVLYARALTRLINRHVLIGRWDGNYNDGVEPTQWVGSEDILARWMQFNQRVRYGQCWVFAGLLTTLLRASGIPARTVTNIGSHHDRGLTSDQTAVLRQYDNIKQADELVWNFHVWSEAWLDRPDLGQPFGWNAVDATPQEPSPLQPGQPYQTGPAYVPYIRANTRAAQYDTLFVLAEVNAQEFCPVTGAPLPSRIGYAVITKRPGMARSVYDYNNPEDITDTYKIQSVSKRDTDEPVLPPPFIGCEREGGLRINIAPSNPLVGDDFTLTITEGNVSEADIIIRMELRNYMGESLGSIRNFTGTRRLVIMESSYMPYLNESNIFLYTVGTHNSTGNFIFHDSLRITLEYNQVEVGTSRDDDSNTITLTLTYTNPFSVPLTGVMVNVAGPDDAYMRVQQPDIAANGRFTATITVECGENDDSDVMIPVSLDSDVTQSVYGTGWSTCDGGSSSGGLAITAKTSVMQVIAISLAICVYLIN